MTGSTRSIGAIGPASPASVVGVPVSVAGEAAEPGVSPGVDGVAGSGSGALGGAPAGLLLLVAAERERDARAAGADAAVILRAAGAGGLDAGALDTAETAGLLQLTRGRIRLVDPCLARTVYVTVPPARRRAAHRLLADAHAGGPRALPVLFHRASAARAPSPGLGDALAAAAALPDGGPTHAERSVAWARSAELATDGESRAVRLINAADQARLAGLPHRARELLAQAGCEGPHGAVRGAAQLVSGQLALQDGPVADAREALLLAAELLAPADADLALAARLAAVEASWAMGDAAACVEALDHTPVRPDHIPARADHIPVRPDNIPAQPENTTAQPEITTARQGRIQARPDHIPARRGRIQARPDHTPVQPDNIPAQPENTAAQPEITAARQGRIQARPDHIPAQPENTAAWPEADRRLAAYRAGMSEVMHGRLDTGREPLREVVAGSGEAGILDGPEALLRAGGAALVVGDLTAACRANSRALAAARARGPYILVAKALERLAYGELRAGRHARARAHAEDGLRTARGAGQDNLAAHHHAILALVASVEGSSEAVVAHADAAERVAASHGLAQAATLSQWARARADLARGRLPEAAARLGPLVGSGPRRGHFAVRMLAVPCFVEAAARTGQTEAARSAVAEFAHWADQGADPQAPAQLARCRALLSGLEECEALFTTALARHEEAAGDFERGRTQLLYGAWLRRRRRPGEARGRLRDALVSFERGGALGWAAQARAELRATGDAGPGEPAGPLTLLTPQQLRIARCVAEGATNREVALRLSVSPRTVDHHLRNVFATLGVRSRVELSRLVGRAEKTAAHP
ncbi:LuxR C-terminal-related transcriptional regulator [Streptomyces sp. NPDC091209]|uniref:helix-turn-helix transcriptional regulator n=1 Tax=Streptomyces sp. NPDC091209 TaxID=3365974 RepID=UPI00381E13C5